MLIFFVTYSGAGRVKATLRTSEFEKPSNYMEIWQVSCMCSKLEARAVETVLSFLSSVEGEFLMPNGGRFYQLVKYVT